MAGAVHRLDAELLALVGAGEPVHVVVELLVMARGLEEIRAEELRRHDFAVAVFRIEIADEAHELVVERHALRQIEGRARGERVEMEESELGADPAVVAALGLLDPLEVLRELLLRGEGGAVDALELLALLVATEVGARGFEQLDRADLARVLDMGAAAEIDEAALAEDRDLGAVGDVGEAGELERLRPSTGRASRPPRASTTWRSNGAFSARIAFISCSISRDVLGREGVLDEEVVLELLRMIAASGVDLGLGKEPLDRRRPSRARRNGGSPRRPPDPSPSRSRAPRRRSSGFRRSTSAPSMRPASAAFASPGPMRCATSSTVTPDRKLEKLAVGQTNGDAGHDRGRAAERAGAAIRRSMASHRMAVHRSAEITSPARTPSDARARVKALCSRTAANRCGRFNSNLLGPDVSHPISAAGATHAARRHCTLALATASARSPLRRKKTRHAAASAIPGDWAGGLPSW